MQQKLTCANILDNDGKPGGGTVVGTGLTIIWQNGPLGRGEDRQAPNGAFVEGVIDAAKQRIEYYQATEFSCTENEDAIEYLELALDALNMRTKRREAEGIEGTHEGA